MTAVRETAVPSARVLLAGVSTRAAAASAARAGFAVTSIDAFGDLDQHRGVHAVSLARSPGMRFTAIAAAEASRTVGCDAVSYLSSFENHPSAVRMLARGRSLWGNPPEVLRRVRSPRRLAVALRRRGFAVPALGDEEDGRRRWLAKPRASGGGHGIHELRPGDRPPPGWYRQELIEGTPGSVVFVAADGLAVPLGLSRQLTGESSFGGGGYRYCGSILAAAGDPQLACDDALFRAARALAAAVAEAFGLVGVNGIDFVARDGVPWPVEVNPRWSASMELVERAYALPVFAMHAAACSAGELPAFDLDEARRAMRDTAGKAVLYALHDSIMPDTREWLADPDVHDVPWPGARIPRGRPICTIFATAPDSAACLEALGRRAARIYSALDVARPEYA